ncbi:uncharacterized protein LOC129924830 [Biomphalaria glabrata]|uniref:Uncharacterized protein LOC129924830 n=1 Tax=Biomphalaria glabrata TaxID=6526 RepID=A0A9W2ZSZ2_BIOGL|nr:uncharacterized protein LOC129924830 [Biomphalaria glabrata]
MFTLIYRENADIVLHVSYLLLDLAVPYFTFLVTIVSTIIIVVQLRSKAKWRSAVVSGQSQSEKSDALLKEKRTSVMLVTVSLIFIVCLIPHSAVLTALSFVRELKLGGAYFNIAFLCYTFTFLMETINCSVSILVYYKMSTKFRTTAQEMLKSEFDTVTFDTVTFDTVTFDTVTFDTTGTFDTTRTFDTVT